MTKTTDETAMSQPPATNAMFVTRLEGRHSCCRITKIPTAATVRKTTTSACSEKARWMRTGHELMRFTTASIAPPFWIAQANQAILEPQATMSDHAAGRDL